MKIKHFCLGTNKFSKYFSQLELSQALKDEEYLYIVKNTRKLGGKGSVARLFSGLGKDKKAKFDRMSELIKKFGGESISYNEEQWLCVCKIKLEDLYEDNKENEIYYNFINNFLRFAFLVEEIRMN